METITDILNLTGRVMADFGIDLFLVIAISFIGQTVKWIFNPDKKIIFIVLFGLGIGIALLQIFVFNIDRSLFLRVAMGYPLMSIAGYMLLKKYGKKYLDGLKNLGSNGDEKTLD